MHKFIVVGPINGYWHLAYKITGTETYSSVGEFTSETAAHREAGFMNASVNCLEIKA